MYAVLLGVSVMLGMDSVEWWRGRDFSPWTRRLVMFPVAFLMAIMIEDLMELVAAVVFIVLIGASLSLALGFDQRPEEETDERA